jgi:hypothetical protein
MNKQARDRSRSLASTVGYWLILAIRLAISSGVTSSLCVAIDHVFPKVSFTVHIYNVLPTDSAKGLSDFIRSAKRDGLSCCGPSDSA